MNEWPHQLMTLLTPLFELCIIAADIIESIVKPTFQDILKLATLVIIRTVISYFLHKEIEDTMTDMEQQEKEPDTPKN